MFKHCPAIKVGDIFTRTDKNGKVWTAEVINRTEHFVDIKKNGPYQVKAPNKCGYGYHYEDAPDTIERCMLYRESVEVEDGTEFIPRFNITVPKKKSLPTNKYYIALKEEFSKHNDHDKLYFIIKEDK